MKPIIHVYVLCWNEEKMIPFFLDHYSKFVDHIYVYDNNSTDKSIKLLKKHDNVTIRIYKSDNQIRDDYYLTIKNHEWKKSKDIADIVIVCDMDEFIFGENILNYMLEFYQSDSTIIKPLGFNMVTEEFDFNTKISLTELIKTGVRDDRFDKMCVFKPNEITDINYTHGCHIATPKGNIIYHKTPLKLLHYKNLTIDYVLNRMEQYKARLSSFNKKYRLGFEYEFKNQEHIEIFNKMLKESSQVI